MKKRVTVSEAVDMLEDIEHKRLSESALRACLKTHGVKISSKDHKMSVTALLKARKSSKANSTGGTGSDEIRAARLEKLRLECRRLEAEIEKVENRQEQDRQRNLGAWLDRIFSTARGRIDAAEQHTIAKFPQHRAMITEFYNAVLKTITDTMDENEATWPERDF